MFLGIHWVLDAGWLDCFVVGGGGDGSCSGVCPLISIVERDVISFCFFSFSIYMKKYYIVVLLLLKRICVPE